MNWIKVKKKQQALAAQAEKSLLARPLAVSDYLAADRVLFFEKGPGKQDILTQMVKALPYQQPEAALAAILEREKLGATVITAGIAIPHARLADVSDITAVLGLVPGGLEAGAEEPVRLLLLFLGPARDIKKNLAFLASISALFQTEGLIDGLLQSKDPQDILKKIAEAEKR